MRPRILPAFAAVLAAATAGGAGPAVAGASPDVPRATADPSPAVLAHEQAHDWRNVEIVGGGFVTGIEYHPTEPGLAYARTDIGGAYRWDTGTERWLPLTDWIGWDDYNLLGIDSIALDPSDPDRVYLAAGAYSQEWASTGAILRSSDRGETWDRVDLPFRLGGNEPGRSIGERLVVDPNDDDVLLLGTRDDGLWRSTDQGATWAVVDGLPSTGQAGIGVGPVLFDPASGETGDPTPVVYASVSGEDAPLHRSDDAGRTWEPVPGQPTGLIPHQAALSTTGALHVSYGDLPGPYEMYDGAVHTHDPGAGTWTDITPLRPNEGEEAGFGYGGLAVDPTDPDTLMVATMGRWGPVDDIFRTTDGGQNWVSIQEGQNLDTSVSPFLDWGDTPKLGWMIGDLEIDPFDPGSVRYVTGATIFGTDDVTPADTGAATDWSVRAEGLEETAVLDLVSLPDGPLISGLGDIGGFTHHDLTTSPPAGMHQNPILGNTTSLDHAEHDPATVVRAGTGDGPWAAYSTDAGDSWQPFPTQPPTVSGGGTIAVSANGDAVVWTPEDGVAHRTTDLGRSWTPSSGLPDGLAVRSDRVDAAVFHAVDPEEGAHYRSDDGGASFALVNDDVPATGQAQWKAVPGVAGEVWLAAGWGGLLRSTDSGESYVQVLDEAHTVGFGAPAPGATAPAVFVTGVVDGVRGVFRSDDSGATWVRVNDDDHQYGWIGQTITGDPDRHGRVYLGTNGRGILYADPIGG
ncbi:WD40/YVTN/BNR-like repeat-containing protein [Actinoalloteichus caeruleus]|uniref:WD40/YVTN/BNR-like repeat-containing protein n=1 Tax=Actinoalloteichus cyanogriseus TaxID=2893586 RepID=UPI0004BF706B|nr:carbohydrate-binding protein [Actinoalloteichus caeruleus]